MVGADLHMEAEGLSLMHGETLIQKGLSFHIRRGGIFVIMGPSGCGKSTLMRHLIGLMPPAEGNIQFNGEDIRHPEGEVKGSYLRRIGVLFQSGALLSSMTLAENVALPLEQHTALEARKVAELVDYKLALVGLEGFGGHYPSQISGGMRKRAGLARAMALDPEMLFLDEPAAGLDPPSSRSMDRLILELRESLAATVVVVTHELSCIFGIGEHAIFLDPVSKTMTAQGEPAKILETTESQAVRNFLSG